jgi:transposase-like protein
MEQNPLLTYAILTVNDSHNKDYYDNFVPFIKETLRKSSSEIVSANEVKEKLMTLFNLNLPINVVNTILKKRLRPKGYLKFENRQFKLNYERLNDSTFEEKRLKMLEKHEKLILDLISFTEKQYKLEVDSTWAEVTIKNFIDSHQVKILEESINKNSFNIPEKNSNKDFIIVSHFIKQLQAQNSVTYDYLIDILKGNMLSNAIYFTEPNMISAHFKGTEIYFDTSFIIYALGLAGDARKEPCSELLSMLKESKAILRCFRHNVDEIIGILEWNKNMLTSLKPDIHGTINYFIEKGYGKSEIERIIYGLDNEIKEKLNIKIIEEVSYSEHEFVISESDLEQFLASKIKYPRPNALEKDLKSISSIMRLRRGKKSLHIEDCRALFVTTNYNLSISVRDYFFNEELPKLIPPVLHDSVITNLVWLKNPSRAPELPSKRLIAECYAASSPKEHLWERYIETLKILEKTHKITTKDLVTLRYTQGARSLLVEKTLGEEDAITIGTVKDILKQIKNEEQLKLETAKSEKENEIEMLKKELLTREQETASSLESRGAKIHDIANKRAKIYTLFLVSLPLAFLSWLLYLAPFIQGLDISKTMKVAVIVLTAVIFPILGLFNLTLIKPIGLLHNKLLRLIKNRIEKKYF